MGVPPLKINVGFIKEVYMYRLSLTLQEDIIFTIKKIQDILGDKNIRIWVVVEQNEYLLQVG